MPLASEMKTNLKRKSGIKEASYDLDLDLDRSPKLFNVYKGKEGEECIISKRVDLCVCQKYNFAY